MRSCTEVKAWLGAQGKGHYAAAVCRAFEQAEYAAAEWVQTLASMPTQTLDELLGALDALRVDAAPVDFSGVDGGFLLWPRPQLVEVRGLPAQCANVVHTGWCNDTA